ncbi:retroelement silencing factor 1 [Ochotona curzoniae]|uniref:retroelement silencing factor 1 n=1 Tax=Ochotona curzoniae TaxID=130825 RepID=UPI001B34AA35|nr:retroelement silencing factor 1 [Ochotona curzoniae]XP_040828151.1 retroelement silencing factor 1 [Ochotona curzoniae]XP_040828152.1 retroelement silencing factor 1 [Ochotona curzoniae]XP_040828153.1 retroelement silencing factor 1 [Ochotona curzoniae]
MNWNAKPEGASLPPQYSKSQPFGQQSSLNQLQATCQSSVRYPGNPEACLYPSDPYPVSQPLLDIRNYKITRQVPVSDVYNRTVVTAQTSVERMTFANMKNPKQLSHTSPLSSGIAPSAWINPPVRTSVPSHVGQSTPQHSAIGLGAPSVHALQGQQAISGSYHVRLPAVPSNSLRELVAFQRTQGFNQSLPEQQVDWPQQYTSNDLTHSDYRPPPRQFSYSSQNFLQDSAVQKHSLEPSPSLQVQMFPNPSLTSQPKQVEATKSYHCAVQTNARLPPPLQPSVQPAYPCRYGGQPSHSAQRVSRQLEGPQGQETHPSNVQKDMCSSFQNMSQNDIMIGKFCNLKVNNNGRQPYTEPVGPSVPGVQAPAQNDQEKRIAASNPSSDAVLDSPMIKEKLVRDIKTLMEIKKKFSELARKIKINKDLLMAAGCSKITNASCSEPGETSELSLKQTAIMQPNLQAMPVAPANTEGQPATVVPPEKTLKTWQVNPGLQETLRQTLDQLSPAPLTAPCAEERPAPEQVHDFRVMTSLKTVHPDVTQTILNKGQLPSDNFVAVGQNTPAISETIPVSQSMSYKAFVVKNKLLLNLLTTSEKTESMLLKDAPKMIPDSTSSNSEMNPDTQVADNQVTLKTVQIPSVSNAGAGSSQNSLCLEQQPSADAICGQNKCPVELLATCLSLWKKQPPKTIEAKQCHELETNRKGIGISKTSEGYVGCSGVGNLQNKEIGSLQDNVVSAVIQNHESSGINVTKGPELQVAVVTPLILSDVKTLSVKAVTADTSPEAIYPVIKEGSVCSLQSRVAECPQPPSALKVYLASSMASTVTSTKVVPLTPKEKQNLTVPRSSQGTPDPKMGRDESGEDVCSPAGDKQTLPPSSEERAMLQIDSICSLVEGDISYNSQIAKIFNGSPVRKAEPHQEETSSRQQKEQLEPSAVGDGCDVQDVLVQCAGGPAPESTPPEPVQPLGPSPAEYVVPSGAAPQESSGECAQKTESTAAGSTEQEVCGQELSTGSSLSAQDPPNIELDDDQTSALYLQDQLSELLREFPYGIEAANMPECSAQQPGPASTSEDCTAAKTDGDAGESTEQIQITVLSSEEMKELFSEEDEDQPDDAIRLVETQPEKSVQEVKSPCSPKAPAKEQHRSVALDTEKDSIYCCALGWLSLVYEGVPQCQCNSTKESAPVGEKGSKDEECRLLEATTHPQSGGASAAVASIASPKVTRTPLEEKDPFPEIQGSTAEGASQMKQSPCPWPAPEQPGESSSQHDGTDLKGGPPSREGSSLSTEKTLPGQCSSRYKSSSLKDHSGMKEKSSLRTECGLTVGQFPPKHDRSHVKDRSQLKASCTPRPKQELSGHSLPKGDSANTKDKSQSKQNSSFRLKQELPAQCSPKWDSSSSKGASQSKQRGSLRKEHALAAQCSSRRDSSSLKDKTQMKKGSSRTERGVAAQCSPKCDGPSVKDRSHPKQSSSLRTQPELATPGASKCDNIPKERSHTKEKNLLRPEHSPVAQSSPKCNSSSTKDRSQPKQSNSVRTQPELATPGAPECDKKTDALSDKDKKERKLKFHVVTFKARDSEKSFGETALQGKLQKRYKPLAPKTTLQTISTSQEQSTPSGVSARSLSPEKTKLKFKAGGSRVKYLEKRKLDVGNIVDMEVKKKRCDEQEENKGSPSVPSPPGPSSSLCESAAVKEQTAPTPPSSDLKAESSKPKRVITAKEYLERRKQKEAMASKASKEISGTGVPTESEPTAAIKLPAQEGSCGKAGEKWASGGLTSSEPLNPSASHTKNLKSSHSEASKMHTIAKSNKEKADGKQPDRMEVGQGKLDQLTSANDTEASLAPSQAKDQRKLYLNRVAFKCTERESICLSKLDSAPWKLSDKEQSVPEKPKVVVSTDKARQLEFKLCPEMLLKKASPSGEDREPQPRVKEQAPAQVSGIKSTKEDWIKCSASKKRMQEASQEIDVNPRLSKRSTSAPGFEPLQNSGKDSKVTFQTYKQMYLEKRSRSLGSSPVK